MSVLGESITELGGWQDRIVAAIRQFEHWLQQENLVDHDLSEQIANLCSRLGQQRLAIAFVAEFSRGKSELINALFFAEHGQRIVPSSAGRTTMCPTELAWDDRLPTAIRLLPIETRADAGGLSQWQANADAWTEHAFDPSDTQSLKDAFSAVMQTMDVDLQRAIELGFGEDETGQPVLVDSDGMVSIPRWRHAVVNLPHPLLESGLSIIDTPGLNAIGSEPDLTLNTIANADAVVFLLAADTGVTRSDAVIWRDHISAAHNSGRYVVLNKIDGLWDELKSQQQVDQEIAGQVSAVAKQLRLDQRQIFPLSAQKGLLAKALHDTDLLERSRLLELERALASDLMPRRQQLVREGLGRDFNAIADLTRGVALSKQRNACEQLRQLEGLRGKNRGVMGQMASAIRTERENFDMSLRQLQGLRSVFSRHSSALYSVTGTDRLKRHVRESRDMMSASRLSLGLRDGMDHLFSNIRADMQEADSIVTEICKMMGAMYRSFSSEHGFTLGAPVMFSLSRLRKEVGDIETFQRQRFGPVTMVTTEKWALMRRFFESISDRIKAVYRELGAELHGWLRTVMAPIESQVREHQGQLKDRLDSVKRVLEANESLEHRIVEIESNVQLADRQVQACQGLIETVCSALAASAQTPQLQAA